MQERAKTGLEVGIVITVGLFLLGIAFNAGIQYARIDDLYTRDAQRNKDIKAVQAEVNHLAVDTPARLGVIETKLDDVIRLENSQHVAPPRRNE